MDGSFPRKSITAGVSAHFRRSSYFPNEKQGKPLKGRPREERNGVFSWLLPRSNLNTLSTTLPNITITSKACGSRCLSYPPYAKGRGFGSELVQGFIIAISYLLDFFLPPLVFNQVSDICTYQCCLVLLRCQSASLTKNGFRGLSTVAQGKQWAHRDQAFQRRLMHRKRAGSSLMTTYLQE